MSVLLPLVFQQRGKAGNSLCGSMLHMGFTSENNSGIEGNLVSKQAMAGDCHDIRFSPVNDNKVQPGPRPLPACFACALLASSSRRSCVPTGKVAVARELP